MKFRRVVVTRAVLRKRLAIFGKDLLMNSNEFCKNTTLQGLKYIVKEDFNIMEKIYFVIWFVSVVLLSGFFILKVYEKWSTTPVIFSVNSESTYINTEPFPAVTICNVNQAERSKAENYGKTSVEYAMLQLLCKRQANITVVDTITDWSNLSQFIMNNSQPCRQMLLVCRFGSIEYNCSDIFHPIVTDEGLCCVFNMVHPTFMYTSGSLLDLNVSNAHGYQPVPWTVETGYPRELPEKYYPRPAVGIGETLGLSLTLDAESENYYCSSMNSIGFKILLHSPTELPSLRELGLLLSAGRETKVRIHTEKVESDPALKSMPIRYRGCLFQEEVDPLFFSHYSQRNCEIETVAGMLLHFCGCISHFMPKVFGNETICSIYDATCVERIRIKSMQTENDRYSYDSCLPSCFDLSYFPDFFSSPLSHSGFQIRNGFVKNLSNQYAERNIAIVHLYYQENSFRSNKQSEFIGMTDFLSSIGGLLGLFFGFSFVSIAELIFYGILRPLQAAREAEQATVIADQMSSTAFASGHSTATKKRFKTRVSNSLARSGAFPPRLGLFEKNLTIEQAYLNGEFIKNVALSLEKQRRELVLENYE